MRRPLLVLLLLTAPAGVAAQQPTVPQGAVTLLEAIALGRSQGINAAIARLDVRAADTRVGQRRADLLPNVSGAAAIVRQTLNLSEFGFPGVSGVTDPFDIYRLQLRASQTLFDASVIARLRPCRSALRRPPWPRAPCRARRRATSVFRP